MAIATLIFLLSLEATTPRSSPVPAVTFGTVGCGVLIAAVGRTMSGRSPVVRWTAVAILIGLGVSYWAPRLQQRAEDSRESALAAEIAERDRLLRGVGPGLAARALYLRVRADEDSRGDQCQRRRFFALARVDDPLALQDAEFSALVFYAGRDIAPARRHAPLGPCDYVVTSPALQETVKGRALVSALFGDRNGAREIADVPPFRLLGRR
jgi:hypothetical protein